MWMCLLSMSPGVINYPRPPSSQVSIFGTGGGKANVSQNVRLISCFHRSWCLICADVGGELTALI